jgi:Molybdopterin-binding domain of aldehyde dehydrogenase
VNLAEKIVMRPWHGRGSAAAHVAVDPGTGDVELLDCLVVEDVGRIVNPLTLHGQAIGGMVQGLGGAFLEDFVYDAKGQLLAGNLADYLIPTATDFPKIRAIALENYRSPSNPLGVKGANPITGMSSSTSRFLTSAIRPIPCTSGTSGWSEDNRVPTYPRHRAASIIPGPIATRG